MVPDGKKILIISSEFPPNAGGIGNHAYHLARSLALEGFDVKMMADIIDVTKKELDDFSSKQTFKIKWIIRKKIVAQTYLQRVFASISLASKAHIIICSGKFSLWLGYFIRRFLSKRKVLIAVVHGSELDIKKKAARKMTSRSLESFDRIISVSNYTSQFLSSTISSTVVKVIHNGIQYEEFHQKQSFKLNGDPALITVGSVTERKGQENVINAFPVILQKYPGAFYHIAGKPVIKSQLQELIKKLNVSSHVNFYGAVDRNKLVDLLAGSHIKLMLSNHTSDGDFEGFGIAVLEANALGIPVIGSRNSGIADAIVHEKTGLLVNQKDPIEIANSIEKILNNYEFYSTNASQWAQQHDWKIIVKQYIETLEAI